MEFLENKSLGSLREVEIAEFKWISEFNRKHSSFWLCLALGLLCSGLGMKSKGTSRPFVAKIEDLNNKVRVFIEENDMNEEIFKNFFGIFQVVMAETGLKAFSYIRFYFEKNAEASLSLEYGVRFILHYILVQNNEQSTLLKNRKVLDWEKCVQVYSEVFSLNVNIKEIGRNTSFKDLSKPVFWSFDLLKNGQNFAYLYSQDFFSLIEGSKNSKSRQNRRRNSEKQTPRNKPNKDPLYSSLANPVQASCKFKTFLKCLEACRPVLGLPEISPALLENHIATSPEVKQITLKQIQVFLLTYIPNRVYPNTLFSLLTVIPKYFKAEPVPESEKPSFLKLKTEKILKQQLVEYLLSLFSYSISLSN